MARPWLALVGYALFIYLFAPRTELLAPRTAGAKLFAVETVDETAAELGLTVEQLRGHQFGQPLQSA